ncbi:MAG: CBS domain-containing protein [Alphaproteobacteria bacterium]|nr:CBS domain-containing protein [Alphaproteobacteria bacterium]
MNLDTPVRALMTSDVLTVDKGASLSDAWTEMLNGGFRHLPVVDGGELVGMLAASDLLAEVKHLPGALRDTGFVPDDRSVGEAMSGTVVSVGVDDPVRAALEHFAGGHLHALPVVAGRRLVGIFTTADLARALLR